ncbi:MAG: flagellar motor switch protein FliN [Moorellaceae bacterium]
MPFTEEEIQQLIEALEASEKPRIKRATFAQLKPVESPGRGTTLDKLLDIPVKVSVELGRTKLKVREILELKEGSLIVLNRLAGDPVDILVNGKLLGQGEVVVINEAFGVRLGSLVEVPGEET